ncbi:protein FAM81A [Exaiptasia diaphana]|uniref:Protein FAM81A n=1 Tax=Exaiptasia diaphana TaxID=2652724 RepID=A0A913Y7K2_EXADI|nr:protein FAM81A [Exaiptasia diaphana]XP_020916066.1 protein FAM81A [Exaiptasia diaphana]
MQRPNSREKMALPAISGEGNQLRHEALSRMDFLEDRMIHQEKTTRSLIDRALRVKEDIEESLGYAQMNWQGEKKARALLQEHIRTITSVVKRLSREIEVIEDELRSKESKLEGNSTAFKNLELHHVAGVTDLRGRVARCDHAIERLIADVRTCVEAINELRQKQDLHVKNTNEKFHNLQTDINELTLKFEKYSAEYSTNIQKMKGDADEQVTRLDSKTKSVVEDLRGSITSSRQWTESEYYKITKDFHERLERMEGILSQRQSKLENKVELYLSKIEKLLEEEKDKYYNIWEVRLKETKSLQDKALGSTSSSMRREYKQGFHTVHESVKSLQNVFEAKLKLVEENLQKSINNVLRMVVLT